MANEKIAKDSAPEDSALAQLVASAVAQATVAVQERFGPTEKRFAPKTSCFNPEGLEVRPKLERPVVFCGSMLDERALTNKEIALLNRIVKPGDYHSNRWHVRVRKDDSDKQTVFIDLPVKSIDQRMEIPSSLTAIINEILEEEAARKA